MAYHLDGDLAILDVLDDPRTKAASSSQQKHGMKGQPSDLNSIYYKLITILAYSNLLIYFTFRYNIYNSRFKILIIRD
jgi:hypothetical protein